MVIKVECNKQQAANWRTHVLERDFRSNRKLSNKEITRLQQMKRDGMTVLEIRMIVGHSTNTICKYTRDIEKPKKCKE